MTVWRQLGMTTSNDTRGVVDGFSKIMASVLPGERLSCPQSDRAFLIALRIEDLAKRFSDRPIEVEEVLGFPPWTYSAALLHIDCRLERRCGLAQDVDALVERGLVGG